MSKKRIIWLAMLLLPALLLSVGAAYAGEVAELDAPVGKTADPGDEGQPDGQDRLQDYLESHFDFEDGELDAYLAEGFDLVAVLRAFSFAEQLNAANTDDPDYQPISGADLLSADADFGWGQLFKEAGLEKPHPGWLIGTGNGYGRQPEKEKPGGKPEWAGEPGGKPEWDGEPGGKPEWAGEPGGKPDQEKPKPEHGKPEKPKGKDK